MSGMSGDKVEEVVRRLVEAARPIRIVLFGSRARGNASIDSDVDLLVIEPEPFGTARSRIKEIGRLERAVGNIPISTDLLVYSEDEVEELKDDKSHIVHTALREGTTLYARP